MMRIVSEVAEEAEPGRLSPRLYGSENNDGQVIDTSA